MKRAWIKTAGTGLLLLAVVVASVVSLLTTTKVGQASVARSAADVDAARIVNADHDPANWLTYGRNYDEQRFSPLARISSSNAKQLGLAWFADLDTDRGQAATPLVIDGVMYVSTAWSMVKAYDAATGKLLWSYDPQVPRELGVKGCCDVVNRGVAAWKGKIYVGAFDGRLVALDATTGKPAWSVVTGDSKNLTITGAPRVVKGRVIIGMSGGEYGIRGYISAYDAETGKLAWRFYTVPGNPADPVEQPVLKIAAQTWAGNFWEFGGGGTVWDGIVYDPKLNLVYFGTGNGSPWNRAYRGDGGGDNLFLASIIAVNADTGAYAWHYQQAPGEGWDYDATSPLMLADLKIQGKARRVLMQASKNGFFYVLDAKTGKVISAQNFVTTTWATGIDLKTGRPQVNPEARYDETNKAATVQPGGQGAHGWHPMSFSPQTGLVYFSAVETNTVFKTAAGYKPQHMAANTGLQSPVPDNEITLKLPREARSQLVAWDPVNQREAWRTPVLGTIGSGTLATAGGLVFQGTNTGRFVAYRASDGKELWSTASQTGVVAAASSFELDGEQYIAVPAGYGLARYGMSNQSRLLVFKLGGTATLPPAPPPPPPPVLNPPASTASAEVIEAGHKEFASHCAMCHDTQFANRGVFPDLRYSPMINAPEAFSAIVLGGALQANGMASFKERMTPDEVESVRAYIIQRANQAKASPTPPR